MKKIVSTFIDGALKSHWKWLLYAFKSIQITYRYPGMHENVSGLLELIPLLGQSVVHFNSDSFDASHL